MNYRTRQREAVLEVLRFAGRPLSVEQIHQQAVAIFQDIGISTVYRLLKQEVEAGRVQRVELPEAGSVYEAASQKHHHYFVCDECHSVLPLEGCVQGIAALLPRGSRMKRHEFVIYGECPDCT
jgi:Fur family ferric uptake transcriptional regulator